MIDHADIGRLKSAYGLFIQQPIQVNNKESPNPHIAYPFWGIHRWSVNSPHKKPMMWKVLSCHMMTSSKETFPLYWPFGGGGGGGGIHWSPLISPPKGHWSSMVSPYKGQWRGDLMFSLISAWTNNWAKNRGAGYLRRHRAHYEVTVMITSSHFS